MIEKQVKEFMTISGQNISNTPHVPHKKLKKFRESLIQEELNEAIESDNLVDLADALGDMCVVLEGYFLTSGLHIYKDRILKEIHRSNMSKFCNNMSEVTESIDLLQLKFPNHSFYYELVADKYVIYRKFDNKVMKGINFTNPNLNFVNEHNTK